ncbi:MAG: hypothetical protein ACWA5A_17190 [Marinibacterium sp.]
MTDDTPDLSIIMTIVDGGNTLRACLEALTRQTGGHNLEILVPYDHMSKEAGAMAADFPDFTFLDLGEVLGGQIPTDDLEKHAFYDTRRSGALHVAKGRLIGIIEDRGYPEPDWADAMIKLHDRHAHGVIGGAVTNGEDKVRNWAVFFCDFGRYQPPLSAENPEYVTDTNIVYKRDTIYSVKDMWDEKYIEASVNWELRRRDAGLLLTDTPITVQHREDLHIGPMLSERFHWARMFGQTRGREISFAQRMKYTLAVPILPFMLLLRHFMRQRQKGHHVGAFIKAAPLTFLLLLAWSAGEGVGYIEAKPDGQE